jgi:hypothetical protein
MMRRLLHVPAPAAAAAGRAVAARARTTLHRAAPAAALPARAASFLRLPSLPGAAKQQHSERRLLRCV